MGKRARRPDGAILQSIWLLDTVYQHCTTLSIGRGAGDGRAKESGRRVVRDSCIALPQFAKAGLLLWEMKSDTAASSWHLLETLARCAVARAVTQISKSSIHVVL